MKKMILLVLTLGMMMAFGMTAFAADSPSGSAHESTSTAEVVSPQTGESDLMNYLGLSAVILGGTAVVAFKKAQA